jgi:tripartite-type tricarboxylate transporter receptor subunit TctC
MAHQAVRSPRRLIAGFALSMALPASAALAAGAEDFYKGKELSVVVGYTTGNAYDGSARALSRHMAKFIPGKPTMIVRNMPGAGSLKAANFLYNVAPKDGATFGIFSRGVPMEPLLGNAEADFDATKFAWVGSIGGEASVCAIWHTSPVKTWDDMLAKPFVTGANATSGTGVYTIILQKVFGAKMKLVVGYPGGNEMSLAIERGELDGRCGWSWSSVTSTKPDWVRDQKISIPVQLGLIRSPLLPDVPTVAEFAKTDRERQILKLIFSRQDMGWPFTAPPAIPEDRKVALRNAFASTMKDEAFLKEARLLELEVNLMTGDDLDKLVDELYATPEAVVAETRAIVEAASK